MSMKVEKTPIPEVLIFTPKVFDDERGFFLESYNQNIFEDAGISLEFVQDNHSLSKEKFTFRGLHFQKPPFDQAKLVRVLKGKILDIFLDLRTSSPTYLEHHMIEISEKK